MEITITDSKIAAGAYKNRTDITSVVLADSVNVIDESAFEGCTALASVTVGGGLTNIGASAFRRCTALTSISVPPELESIGDWAFRGCTALTEVVFRYRPSDTDDDVQYGMDVYYIGIGAFYGCTSLVYLRNLGSGQLETVSAYTFYNCINFKGSRSLGAYRKTRSVGHYAFYNCTSLGSPFSNFGDKAEIGDYAYYGTAIEDITRYTELVIGNYAFANSKLTSVKLYNVTYIGEGAFMDCADLTNVMLGQSLKYIGPKAFCNCVYLKYLLIPHGVSRIYNATFQSAGLWAKVFVADFGTHTIIPELEDDYANENFYDTEYVRILVPKELLSDWRRAAEWKDYSSQIIDASLKGISSSTDIKHLGNPRIRFNIHDKRFIAEKGMTWAEWCDSKYNTYALAGEKTKYGLDLRIIIDDRTDRYGQYTYTVNWPCRDDVTSLYNDGIDHDIEIPDGFDVPIHSIPSGSIHPYEKIVDGTTYWSGLGYQVD